MLGRKRTILFLGDEQVNRLMECYARTLRHVYGCAVLSALFLQLLIVVSVTASPRHAPLRVASLGPGPAFHPGGNRWGVHPPQKGSKPCRGYWFQNNSIAISPNGRLLVWGAGPILHVWDIGGERQLQDVRVADDGCIFSLAFLAPGGTLALSLIAPPRPPTKLLWIIEPDSGRLLSGTLSSSIFWWWWVMCGSIDGRWLAYDDNDLLPLRSERLWLRETKSGAIKSVRWKLKLLTTALAFSPDDRLLAVARMDGGVHLLSVPSLEDQRDFEIRKSVATCVAFSRDGTLLAAGRRDGGISLWEVEAGVELPTLKAHNGPVASLAFAPLGSTMASAGKDGIIRLWDPHTGKVMSQLTSASKSPISVTFSPDGKTLASIADDGTVRLWDVATGSQLLVLDRDTGKPESLPQQKAD